MYVKLRDITVSTINVKYNIIRFFGMDAKSRHRISCILLLSVSCVLSSDCDRETDCVSCTSKSSWFLDFNCRWCPLDRECHAFGSVLGNPCTTDQNLDKPSKCYDKTIGEYNPNSAFVNTLLAAVAYSENPESCLESILPDSGFRLVEAIGRKCDKLTIFNYEHCFAFTAVSDSLNLIVVAFKGTADSLKQLWDEAGTVLFRPKAPFMIGGEVQVYFKNVFELFYSCVKESVRQLLIDNPEYDIVVTGHSLGGAIASMVAAAFIYEGITPKDKTALYTFGMPRVGDKEYAIQHDRLVDNSWRVVHYRDIVAHLPTCNVLGIACAATDGPSHHGIEVYYRQDQMTVNTTYKICKSDEDDSCSNGDISYCFPDNYGKCIVYHKHYFGIPVGTYCDKGMSGKRSIRQRAEFWSGFEDDKCKRVSFAKSTTTNNGHTMFYCNIGYTLPVFVFTFLMFPKN